MEEVQLWLRTLLISGSICAVLLFMCPEGTAKALLKAGCLCLMLLVVLLPLQQWRGQNLTAFSSVLQEYRSMAQNIREDAAAVSRLVMEREYAAYILSEAEKRDIDLPDVQVETEQNALGTWIPRNIRYGAPVPKVFAEAMAQELGLYAGGEEN